jgi:hypothetical protein
LPYVYVSFLQPIRDDRALSVDRRFIRDIS